MTKLILWACLIPVFALAQSTTPIECDRPDQTETPALVPKGRFQMENGFSFEQTRRGEHEMASPSSLLKWGVNDFFELRLIVEVLSVKSGTTSVSGLAPLLVGFKSKLADEKGWIPKTSFIAHLSLPNAASRLFKTPYYAPEFRFTMQHTLSEDWSLGYNLGAEWDGFVPEPTFIYTLTGGVSLTEMTGFYAELYGFAPQDSPADHRWDAGFTHRLDNDTMLDISGGTGFSPQSPDWYAALGFSFRL